MREKLTNCFEIKDMDPEVLAEVLRFLYTGRALNLENMAIDLLAVANMFLLDRLREMCEEAMYNNLTVENVCEALILADRHLADQLKARSIEFIVSHASKVVRTPGLRQMMSQDRNLFDEVFCSGAIATVGTAN